MKRIKGFLIVGGILTALFSWGFSGIWYGWWYPKTYEYPLRLADDASLPKQKADYLNEYLSLVENIKNEPAYIFMTPDKKLGNQKILLAGLIERFEDIAKLVPSEMAYQTGMQQLTGQEMEHQLDRVSHLFMSAKLRENYLIFFIVAYLWIVGALAVIAGSCVNEY